IGCRSASAQTFVEAGGHPSPRKTTLGGPRRSFVVCPSWKPPLAASDPLARLLLCREWSGLAFCRPLSIAVPFANQCPNPVNCPPSGSRISLTLRVFSSSITMSPLIFSEFRSRSLDADRLAARRPLLLSPTPQDSRLHSHRYSDPGSWHWRQRRHLHP